MNSSAPSQPHEERQQEELPYYEVSLPYPGIIPAEHGIRVVQAADLEAALLAARIATPSEVVRTLKQENAEAEVVVASLEGDDRKVITVGEWMEMGSEMRECLNRAWKQVCQGRRIDPDSHEGKRVKQELRLRHALYLPAVAAVA